MNPGLPGPSSSGRKKKNQGPLALSSNSPSAISTVGILPGRRCWRLASSTARRDWSASPSAFRLMKLSPVAERLDVRIVREDLGPHRERADALDDGVICWQELTVRFVGRGHRDEQRPALSTRSGESGSTSSYGSPLEALCSRSLNSHEPGGPRTWRPSRPSRGSCCPAEWPEMLQTKGSRPRCPLAGASLLLSNRAVKATLSYWAGGVPGCRRSMQVDLDGTQRRQLRRRRRASARTRARRRRGPGRRAPSSRTP